MSIYVIQPECPSVERLDIQFSRLSTKIATVVETCMAFAAMPKRHQKWMAPPMNLSICAYSIPNVLLNVSHVLTAHSVTNGRPISLTTPPFWMSRNDNSEGQCVCGFSKVGYVIYIHNMRIRSSGVPIRQTAAYANVCNSACGWEDQEEMRSSSRCLRWIQTRMIYTSSKTA